MYSKCISFSSAISLQMFSAIFQHPSLAGSSLTSAYFVGFIDIKKKSGHITYKKLHIRFLYLINKTVLIVEFFYFNMYKNKQRVQDSNLRPFGYEPNEHGLCSNPPNILALTEVRALRGKKMKRTNVHNKFIFSKTKNQQLQYFYF